MKFAKRVFLAAGVLGIVALPPMYFMAGVFGRLAPPAITHVEFYYGFVGITLAFQVVYLIIGLDPLRYRALMPIAALAKGSFVASTAALVAAGRVPLGPAMSVAPDLVFAVLFVIAYRMTGRVE